jgi:NlpC/P60 family putative phage cell wall peptidase
MDPDFRARIVSVAEQWIGTPYRHQGSKQGVGCDCLGLLRGVWRAMYGTEPEKPGAYSRDWAEFDAGDALMDQLLPGTVILFRWREGMAAKHVGIATGSDRFIHAYERMAVTQSPLVPHWKRRIAGLFDFPEPTEF